MTWAEVVWGRGVLNPESVRIHLIPMTFQTSESDVYRRQILTSKVDVEKVLSNMWEDLGSFQCSHVMLNLHQINSMSANLRSV